MKARTAKKLHRGDEVEVKETGAIETVMYLQVDDGDVIIFTCEGSDYHPTQVK